MNHLRLHWLWERLRTSYWFVPALMILGAIGLSLGLGALDDARQDREHDGMPWLWTGGPEGARTLLGTLAGATITVASTIFSITIVALTLAANSFGPRLLRNFMRDRGNQLVLGAFTATFVYCLLVLRSVRGDDTSPFVPHVSITVALAFALANVGVLIYFIHHVATSIQADQVVVVASRDLDEAIARYLARADERPDEPEARLPDRPGAALRATCSGYLQGIDEDQLLAAMCRRDALIRLTVRPGDFITEGAELARVWLPGRDEALDQPCTRELQATLLIDDQRTPVQDLEYSLHQLVEIAARALSPGINDPFTAITCIDWLSAALCKLAAGALPGAHRRDPRGALRIVDRPFTFEGAINAALDPMRQHAANSPLVLIRLMDGLLTLACCARAPEARAAVLQHAHKVERAGSTWTEGEDRQALRARLHRLTAVLDARRDDAASA